MNTGILIAFIAGMLVLSASPGPGVLASVAKAVSDGFRESLFLIGGLASGDVIFLLLAVFGMSAVSQITGEMFFIIKIAGGIYLIFLGIKLFKGKSMVYESRKIKNKGRLNTYLSGFMVTMGNPKPILFYASVVPTIVNLKKVGAADTVIMAIVIISVSFLVIGTYCYLASYSRKYFMKNKFNKNINKLAGAIMCAAGGYIIIK